jgi:hypothetical protein
MWLKLTEIKISGYTKTILLNADCISHMMPAERNNADTYIKMRERDAVDTFYFVKETIDQICGMLVGVPIMASLPPLTDDDMKHYSAVSNYTTGVR